MEFAFFGAWLQCRAPFYVSKGQSTNNSGNNNNGNSEPWQSFDSNGLKFELSKDGTYYTVTGFTYTNGVDKHTIPAEKFGIPVKAIGDEAFRNYGKDTLYFDDDCQITHIGALAFVSSKIKTISLPASVISIGEGAFQASFSIESLAIPAGITEIAPSLFQGCWCLTEVILPEGITVIGNSAFENTALREVTLPNSITSIADGMFSGCENLTSMASTDFTL